MVMFVLGQKILVLVAISAFRITAATTVVCHQDITAPVKMARLSAPEAKLFINLSLALDNVTTRLRLRIIFIVRTLVTTLMYVPTIK